MQGARDVAGDRLGLERDAPAGQPGLDALAPALVGDGPHDVADALADDVHGGAAQPLQARAVDEAVALVGVEVGDGHRQVVGDRAQLALDLGAPGLGLLQRGDVEGHQVEAALRAAVAAVGDQVGLEVRRAAGVVHLALEARTPALQGLAHIRLVQRVHRLAERGAHGQARDVGPVDAQRAQARVVGVLAGLAHVEVAHHRGDRVGEVGHALLAARDLEFGSAPLGDVHGQRVAAAHGAVGADVGDVLGQQVALDAVAARAARPLHALAGQGLVEMALRHRVGVLAQHLGHVATHHAERVVAQPFAELLVGEAVPVPVVDVAHQRGQVVGDVAQLLLRAVALPVAADQRGGHRVELARQVAEFVLRGVVQAKAHVAATDGGGRPVEALHGQQHAPLHHRAAGQQHQQHHARRRERDPLELALRGAALRHGVLEPLVGVVAHRLRVREELVQQRLLAALREAVVGGGQFLQAREQRRQRLRDVAQFHQRRVAGRAAVVGQRGGDRGVAQAPLLGRPRLRVARVLLREREQARHLVLGGLRARLCVARGVLAPAGREHDGRGQDAGAHRGGDEREELGADAHGWRPSRPFRRRPD